MKLDHVVSVETSLSDAVRRWQEAGFEVVPGGRHRDTPTENALVPLGGGVYLELLGLRERSPEGRDPPGRLPRRSGWGGALDAHEPVRRRFGRLVSEGRGLADLCLRVEGSLEDHVERIRAAGVVIDGPVRMSRIRPDGVELEWRLAVPADPLLPFLIEDLTDPALRGPVPGSDATARCTGVVRVDVCHPRPEDVLGRFEVLCDASSDREDASLRLGDVSLTVQPASGLGLRDRIRIYVGVEGAFRERALPGGVTPIPRSPEGS